MIKKYKPTSPGIRSRKTLIHDKVTKRKPEKGLTEPLKGPVGRRSGTISVRHRERGAKKFYRIVDFKRDKLGIPAKVAAIEYDPNRGPDLALLHYADGEKRYILAPEGLQVNSKVESGPQAELIVGNALPLDNIPLGFEVHNIELNPGKGGQIARGAGNKGVLLAKDGNYVNIKLPSGEVKKFAKECYATIGALGNSEKRLGRLGKAGLQRHLGNRPHVRGVAMANPKDHPHAGSYSDTGTGHPKTPWGKPARGVKTRSRKQTNKYIVTPRKKKKR
jgi:large subunit ribosomal protein L2